MKFTTTRFGEIEFPDEVVMEFPDGVLGFARDTRFILLEHDAEGSPFKWLQSLNTADLAFIVIDPNTVETRYHYDIDLDTALSWGRLQGEAEQAGEKLPVMDSLIAATAVAHGLVVVTRNVRDMERCGVKVCNPWESIK